MVIGVRQMSPFLRILSALFLGQRVLDELPILLNRELHTALFVTVLVNMKPLIHIAGAIVPYCLLPDAQGQGSNQLFCRIKGPKEKGVIAPWSTAFTKDHLQRKTLVLMQGPEVLKYLFFGGEDFFLGLKKPQAIRHYRNAVGGLSHLKQIIAMTFRLRQPK